MPTRFKCTLCAKDGTFDTRSAAAAEGWQLVDLLLRGARPKYVVLCPDEKPKWLEALLKDLERLHQAAPVK